LAKRTVGPPDTSSQWSLRPSRPWWSCIPRGFDWTRTDW
jgi:hypothetical protein